MAACRLRPPTDAQCAGCAHRQAGAFGAAPLRYRVLTGVRACQRERDRTGGNRADGLQDYRLARVLPDVDGREGEQCRFHTQLRHPHEPNGGLSQRDVTPGDRGTRDRDQGLAVEAVSDPVPNQRLRGALRPRAHDLRETAQHGGTLQEYQDTHGNGHIPKRRGAVVDRVQAQRYRHADQTDGVGAACNWPVRPTHGLGSQYAETRRALRQNTAFRIEQLQTGTIGPHGKAAAGNSIVVLNLRAGSEMRNGFGLAEDLLAGLAAHDSDGTKIFSRGIRSEVDGART